MFSMPKRRSSCAFKHAVLFDDLVLVERPLDGDLQFFVNQRLGEEIEGAQADRLDGRFNRAIAGDHDDRGGRLLAAAIGQHLESVVAAQADVGQHQVVGLAVHGRGGLGHIGGGVGLVALVAEPVGHRGHEVPIVVHQQQRAALLHRNTLRVGRGLSRFCGLKTTRSVVAAKMGLFLWLRCQHATGCQKRTFPPRKATLPGGGRQLPARSGGSPSTCVGFLRLSR